MRLKYRSSALAECRKIKQARKMPTGALREPLAQMRHGLAAQVPQLILKSFQHAAMR